MFERFNINDLYLAHVIVISPDTITTKGSSYGYLTILKKNGENYIDLQNMNRIITTNRDSSKISYVIYKKEPLSNHYTQNGSKKSINRKNAVNIGRQYYSALNQEKTLAKAK